jgi:hypothetical protein
MSLHVQPRFGAAQTGSLPVRAPIQGVAFPPDPSKADTPSTAAKAQQDEGFSFWDVLDIINPLQNIPIIGGIYRAVTGDKIHNISRVAGGALFGGIAGAALGLVNVIAVDQTGQDVGQMAMAKIGFTPSNAPDRQLRPDIQVADTKKEKSDTAFAQTVPLQDIPYAMRDALIKYQSLKSADMAPMENKMENKTNEPNGGISPRRFRDTLPPDRLIRS